MVWLSVIRDYSADDNADLNEHKKKTMKQINIIILLWGLLVMVACGSDSDSVAPAPEPQPPVVTDDALVFTTTAEDRSTRADEATETGPLLHALGYNTFGIWTWRTSETLPSPPAYLLASDWKSVMSHYHVSYDSKYTGEGRGENGWGYDKEAGHEEQVLKYWNMSSTYYSFKGYAPWVGSTVSVSDPYVSVGTDHKLLYHNVTGHFAARDAVTEYSPVNKNKVDWLYTNCQRTMTNVGSLYRIDCDSTISDHEKWFIGYNDKTVTKTVPLRFHHLLPKVIFRLHVYDGRTGHELDEIYQRISVSVKPHDDAFDNAKDTPIYTSAETVNYVPTGTSPNLVYVSGTPSGYNEFADETPASPAVDWTTATFRTFSKADDTDYQDISPINSDGSKRGWLELPQKAPAFDVRLEYGASAYGRILAPTINEALPKVWEPDHIYVYVIHFNIAAPILEVTSYAEEWSSTDDDFKITDW